jgi:hypothetical protein
VVVETMEGVDTKNEKLQENLKLFILFKTFFCLFYFTSKGGIEMNLKKSNRVIYVTAKNDQVYTAIKEVNEQEELYTLDFNNELVQENKVKLNTHSAFSVPSLMTDEYIVAYHYDQLVNHILDFLINNNPFHDVNISVERDNIYFETRDEAPKNPEEIKYFREKIDKLNALIGQVNSQIKSRFNKHIQVILKFPLNTHHLHHIRI